MEVGPPTHDMQGFDPDAAATSATIFGLPHGEQDARVHLLGVPFEATCSYNRGTAGGPKAILRGSHQVDLHDPQFGAVWQAGIWMHPGLAELAQLNARASAPARNVIDAGGPRTPALRADARRVDALARRRSQIVEQWTAARLGSHIPGIVGGDHSAALGAIRAAAREHALTVLHLDAHHDLRVAYEGFVESHASIFDNVLRECPRVERVVQLGVRDYSAAERVRANEDPRVSAHDWTAWNTQRFSGTSFAQLIGHALDELSGRVWISFDIDALEPSLCPGTGTPVPGGFTFDEAAFVLERFAATGKQCCGFDLCEVGPGTWDGNVGARILYKLCGLATSVSP